LPSFQLRVDIAGAGVNTPATIDGAQTIRLVGIGNTVATTDFGFLRLEL
jgi:hypothetical protein